MIIGLTGGIATGKSTVSKYLKELSYNVIDTDKIAKDITTKKDVLDDLRDYFGDSVFKDNILNRKKLRSIVFNDNEKLKKLNSITHSKILDHIRVEMKKCSKESISFVDIPLLYEVGFENETDYVVVVSCSIDTEINRIINRDSISAEDAKSMIKAQMPLEEKLKKADYIINNDGSLEELKENTNKILTKLKESV